MALDELPVYPGMAEVGDDPVTGAVLPDGPTTSGGWGVVIRAPQPPRLSWLARLERALESRPGPPVNARTSHVTRRCRAPLAPTLLALERQLPVRDPALDLRSRFTPVVPDGTVHRAIGRLHVEWAGLPLPVALTVSRWSGDAALADLHLRRALRPWYPQRYFDVAHAALDRLLGTAGLVPR